MQRTSGIHALKIAGRKTSISVEAVFWSALQEIAKERNQTVNHLVTTISAKGNNPNLSSAVRLYVLDYYQRGRKTPGL
jgi:predicted DNA-binding ribbon-helix-helix protein